jgi:hypothetical protein
MRSNLANFSTVWSIATLYHVASRDDFLLSATGAVLALACWAAVVTPRALPAAAICQFADLWYWMPMVDDHWTFVAIVNLAILIAWLRSGGDEESAFARIAAAGRVATVLLYAFVMLHRCNVDFLRPETSAATMLYRAAAESCPFLPTGPVFDRAAIWVTLIVEAAIPLLLASPWFGAGVLLGAAFHFLLAFHPFRYYDFSAIMFALYFLFLPNETTKVVGDAWRIGRPHRRGIAATIALVFAASLGALWASADGASLRNITIRAVGTSWALYGGTMCVVYAFAARRRLREPRSLRAPEAAIVAALMLFNGLNPYLGLSTAMPFDMYTNLRTAGERPNHLFMPSIRLTDWQDEFVEIVASTDPAIGRYAGTRWRVPLFELRRLAAAAPQESVTYRYRGATRTVARIGDDPTLAPPGYLLRKLVRIRPIKEPTFRE